MSNLVCLSQSFQIKGLTSHDFQWLAERTGFAEQLDSHSSSPAGVFEFSNGGGLFELKIDDALVCSGQTLELTAELIRARVYQAVQAAYPETTFLQADVVRWTNDRAILLLGPALSGKSRLAQALVTAGGEMWSESFAAVSKDSTLLPFPRPEFPEKGLTVGAIVIAPFRPGAPWTPTVLSAGDAVLRLIEMLGGPQAMKPAVLPQLAQLAGQASLVVMGERGNCDSIVSYLREHLPE